MSRRAIALSHGQEKRPEMRASHAIWLVITKHLPSREDIAKEDLVDVLGLNSSALNGTCSTRVRQTVV
jgi:hypothetical protein